MIQVETTVISDNCTAWKDRLNDHRKKLNECQANLQEVAQRQLSREQLQEVEQLHNQCHVQLLNIHDLKHAIRAHLKKTGYELGVKNGHLNDDTLAEHEELLQRYSALEERLHELHHRSATFKRQFA